MIALHWLDGAARVAAQFRSSRLLGRRASVLRVGRYGARAAAQRQGERIARSGRLRAAYRAAAGAAQPATRELRRCARRSLVNRAQSP
jgi:hypothetical protein